MGSWDELCLLCGIRTDGGPLELLSRYDLDDLARQIAEEIRVDTDANTDLDQNLTSVVTDALASTFSEDDQRLGYRPSWLPIGLGRHADDTQSTCVAIGYFDQDKEGQAPIRDDGRIPDGRNVEVRRVRDDIGGDFRVVVRTVTVEEADNQQKGQGEAGEDGDGDEVETEREEFCDSACSVAEVNHPHNPNFWLCERCYQHLNAWLDVESLPCRSSALRSGSEPMSLAGELYEIVNSQLQRRLDTESGLLPCIDYDGIEDTLLQYQDSFYGGRRGSRHIAKGIRTGLRGAELIPAMMRDFRCWMFMEPDVWPEPVDSCPGFASFQQDRTNATPTIARLPVELSILILRELPVDALLSLSATCKALRALITDPEFMDYLFHEALLRGALRWILPATRNEIPRANEVAARWLSKSATPATNTHEEDFPSPFAHPRFPCVAFVYACSRSDSMRNRKRIWGLVKQFERLWREYRVKGWPVDRFYPSNEISASGHDTPHLTS